MGHFEVSGMYQVLVVDDEKEIRDGLAAWPWEALGLQLAGCCSHGLEALQFMSEHTIDIVMTDIRMPFMDGIELMEALRRQYPYANVVILSGHNDFDYAQQSIRLGAVDYLLKPIHFPALSRTLEQLIDKLDAQKQAEYRYEVLKRKEQLLARVLRETFLQRLLEFRMSPDDIEQASSEGEVLLDGDSFTAAAFRLDRLSLHQQDIPERELRLLTFSLDNILHDLWDVRESGYHLVNRQTAEFFLLSKKPDPHESFAAILPQMVKYIGLFRSTFSAGIGPTVRQPEQIHASAHSALLALHGNRKAASVSACSEEACFKAQAAQQAPDPARGLPLQAEEEEGRNNVVLVQAKRFIQDNYHRSITLKEAAAHVYVSPGHLSALFKDTGESFLKYLTAIRINKAAELLQDSCFKVYEVVEMVGYSDPAYFAEVFKKHTGKTPNEYRGKLRTTQEAEAWDKKRAN